MSLLETLGIDLPIIQAPMAGVAGRAVVCPTSSDALCMRAVT